MATSRSFLQFARRLKGRGEEFERNLGQKIRRAALKADQTVVLQTPVDTGRAKTNWLASLDSPLITTIGAAVPGTKGSTKEANEQQALNLGSQVISQFRVGKNSSIFISNSLPYIEQLENGSSDQAPEGMVNQAIQAAQVAFQFDKVFKKP